MAHQAGQVLSSDGTLAPSGGLVLLVDDEPLLLRALARILRSEGHRLILAETLDEIGPALEDPELDAVLLDLFLGADNGIDVLERVKAQRPDVEVVMMTGHASVESAVGSMRRGAFDYLEKPFEDAHRVRNTIRRAVERRRLVSRNRELERELSERGEIPSLIGRSPRMRAIARKIHRLPHNLSNGFHQGESGTGKEVVARAIHAASPRRDNPFVPVDCGALPESIIESELFGHERGAFTGAVGAPGLFRIAHGGTLFLDEIGEIPASIQAKLLRALQHKEVRPVGSASAVPVEFRVVCATNRDLAEMVRAGLFRADLYYRLDVVRIQLPPLRERLDDVPLLAHHLLEKHRPGGDGPRGFEPDALALLMRHSWPGNVRELENAIESALALARGDRLNARDFSLAPVEGLRTIGRLPGTGELPLSLDAYERCALERALRESGGDARQAARCLGIGRSTLYRKLAKHGLSSKQSLRQVASGLGGAKPIG